MSKKTNALEKAFDSSSMAGKLIDLNEEQATEFFSLVEDESTFLKKIRTHTTVDPTGTLGKITADGTFLHPGVYNTANSDNFEFGAVPVTYTTKLVRGSFIVYDSEIRNNIEKESLESKLLSIVAKKVANDYENMALYARQRANAVSVLELFDGIIWRAMESGSVVDATTFSDRYVDRAKLRAMQKTMKSIYQRDAEWFASPNIMMDYEDLYVTVADSVVRNELISRMVKKPTNLCTLMTDESPVLKSGGASTTVASGVSPINTAGQNKIEVASASGLSVGDSISIMLGTDTEQTFTITGISSTTLTLDANLKYTVSVGNTVKEVTLDGAHVVYGDPQNMIWVQQVGRGSMTFEAERLAGVGRKWHYTGNVDLIVLHDEKLGVVKNLKVRDI